MTDLLLMMLFILVSVHRLITVSQVCTQTSVIFVELRLNAFILMFSDGP